MILINYIRPYQGVIYYNDGMNARCRQSLGQGPYYVSEIMHMADVRYDDFISLQ